MVIGMPLALPMRRSDKSVRTASEESLIVIPAEERVIIVITLSLNAHAGYP
jgi:hypothetical protein